MKKFFWPTFIVFIMAAIVINLFIFNINWKNEINKSELYAESKIPYNQVVIKKDNSFKAKEYAILTDPGKNCSIKTENSEGQLVEKEFSSPSGIVQSRPRPSSKDTKSLIYNNREWDWDKTIKSDNRIEWFVECSGSIVVVTKPTYSFKRIILGYTSILLLMIGFLISLINNGKRLAKLSPKPINANINKNKIDREPKLHLNYSNESIFKWVRRVILIMLAVALVLAFLPLSDAIRVIVLVGFPVMVLIINIQLKDVAVDFYLIRYLRWRYNGEGIRSTKIEDDGVGKKLAYNSKSTLVLIVMMLLVMIVGTILAGLASGINAAIYK